MAQTTDSVSVAAILPFFKSWLPREVVLTMVTRFEQTLCDQIFTMMVDRVKRHARASSKQSASALSTGSHRNTPQVDVECDSFDTTADPVADSDSDLDDED